MWSSVFHPWGSVTLDGGFRFSNSKSCTRAAAVILVYFKFAGWLTLGYYSSLTICSSQVYLKVIERESESNQLMLHVSFSHRVLWIGPKEQRTKATSISRPANMRTPSSATQTPSLSAPQSRRLTCQHFTRTEQQHMSSRLAESKWTFVIVLYRVKGINSLLQCQLNSDKIRWGILLCYSLFFIKHQNWFSQCCDTRHEYRSVTLSNAGIFS